MTQLELVKNEQIIGRNGQQILKTIVAVSTSYDALTHYAKTNGISVDVLNCGKHKTTHHIIQESDIVIVPFNFKTNRTYKKL